MIDIDERRGGVGQRHGWHHPSSLEPPDLSIGLKDMSNQLYALPARQYVVLELGYKTLIMHTTKE